MTETSNAQIKPDDRHNLTHTFTFASLKSL